MITREEKQKLIQARSWYHSIEIEPGLVTPGRLSQAQLQQMLRYINLPASLEGLSVLDIGAWDGFYSFEAEKRGAKRVVAYDLNPVDYYGFDTARKLLNSKVEFVQGSVYDLSSQVHGTFDVVLFLGVFYHLRYPLLALDRIRQVAKQYMILETNCMDQRLLLTNQAEMPLREIDSRLTEIPLYRFYRFDELMPGDFSNWFSPNRQAIQDALWSAGFRPEFLAEWSDRIAFKGMRLDSIPEYLLETYEGLQWTKNADGSPSPMILKHGATQIADEIVHPQIQVGATEELTITPPEEMQRLRTQVNTAQTELAHVHTQLAELRARNEALKNLLTSLKQTRPYRLLRQLGMWGWLAKAIKDLA